MGNWLKPGWINHLIICTLYKPGSQVCQSDLKVSVNMTVKSNVFGQLKPQSL